MSNWTSVEDRLPDKTKNVLVFANDIVNGWQEVLNCYVCPEYGNAIWEYLDCEDFPCIVTHWQELPEPPTK